MKLKYMLISFISLLMLLDVGFAQNPPTIEPTDAAKNLQKRVEPVYPAIAKAARISGKVVLLIDIDQNGNVKNIRLVSGHPMLNQAAIDSVRQWKYKPFLENNEPMTVSTKVDIHFGIEETKEELDANENYFKAWNKCYDLAMNSEYQEAEKRCREAVLLSEKLPKEAVLERSSAHNWLGNTLFRQDQYEASIVEYQKAIELDVPRRKQNDYDLGGEYSNLAAAFVKTNRFEKADELYAKSVTIMEAAIVNLPDMKERYVPGLKRVLHSYADLKRTMGDREAANALDDKANKLKI